MSNLPDGNNQFDAEDEMKATPGQKFKDFECPDCTAHNPYDDGFKAGDEVRCFYCGSEFKVLEADGKLRFRSA